uniref:Lipoprotein n=1 Tax=Dechloromonas aromatica (strain RCB) TaxID=159087 RepID=Q47HD6_DECAR
MFFLRYIFTAASVAAFLGAVQAAETAERQYVAIAKLPADGIKGKVGQIVEVDVDLSAPGSLEVNEAGERLDVLYRMSFNQLAEGWSWQPLADPAVEDYYRFKFLPLQSVADERGEYVAEDKIGTPQQMKISWRYDYFLAFENLYDFYPRKVDDDSGFSANLPAAMAGHVGLRAKARLVEPVISESTTFWKAIYSRPTDFTLKKRYLVGRLEEVDFVDTTSGEVLCRIQSGQERCTAR